MRRRILIAGWGTLILFPLLGWGILQFFEDDALGMMVRSEMNFFLQIIAGAAVGVALGYLAQAIITRPFMGDIEDKYARVVSGLNLNRMHIVFLSFCAGFGEELLFRGALQPLAGVWITAIGFVALHGYLSPFSWRISLYGAFMVLAIALLGYMADGWGIIAACTAHMAIDIVLFAHLTAKGETLKYVYESSEIPTYTPDEVTE
jgi:membrane protease YdiL (CAAX protease family)